MKNDIPVVIAVVLGFIAVPKIKTKILSIGLM